MLIAGDLLIFTLLFVSFAGDRNEHPALFESGRQALDAGRGGVNTLLLLTSSWCVVKALAAIREERPGTAGHWLAAAIGCGAGFALSKALEYSGEVGAGHTAADGGFFMYYFLLTGLHLAHVVVGCAVLAVFLAKWRSPDPVHVEGFESAAAFWHMVDLLWVLIFSLLYLAG